MILQFWQQQSIMTFQKLVELACHMSVPTSSAPVERLLSVAEIFRPGRCTAAHTNSCYIKRCKSGVCVRFKVSKNQSTFGRRKGERSDRVGEALDSQSPPIFFPVLGTAYKETYRSHSSLSPPPNHIHHSCVSVTCDRRQGKVRIVGQPASQPFTS